MSSMERRPIEDVVDEALQSLLDGEPLEAILARYPEYGDDLGAMLFAADTLKRAPQPQLSHSSLAAMVAQAQTRASEERKAILVATSPNNARMNGKVDEIEQKRRPAGSMKPATQRTPGWLERIGRWMLPPNRLSRVPAALLLVLLVVLGVYAMSRIASRPQPPVLSVPTVSSRFTLDEVIQRMAADQWLVGGNTIYIDTGTGITGTPALGEEAHVEGEITGDNHRIARNITVGPQATGTVGAVVTAVGTATRDIVSGPTTGPTAPAITGPATISPVVTAVPGGDATATVQAVLPAPATATEAPVAATATPPKQNVPATAPPTSQPTSTSQPPVSEPTETEPPVIPSPSATAQPPSTETPEATEPPEATETETAEPTVPPSPTRVEPPTAEPSDTPQPTPTQEPANPTNTPRPRPTATSQPEPTESPEPEDSPTPRPTSIQSRTPTPVPTHQLTVTPEPSTTEEPPQTQTAEPTDTRLPTLTALPTGTGEPEGTHTVQPTQTEQASSTQTPEH